MLDHVRLVLLGTILLPSLLPAQNDAPAAELTIPAYSGYAHPDPRAVRRDRKTGAVERCDGQLVFYVEAAATGAIEVRVRRLAGAPAQRLKLRFGRVGGKSGTTQFVDAPASTEADTVLFRGLVSDAVGPLRISLQVDGEQPLRRIASLALVGEGAAGARASTVERRNASSVHLWYDVPTQHVDDIEYFYCELTPTADPLWTYYMATGWHRGYFGMQVNSATERRVIFSVWDSGNEAVDRGKVGEQDLVQLLRKGADVHAGGFGNEGTGGHSHLVHDWQLGDTIGFLVRAQPDGKQTTYTGWFAHHRAGAAGPEPWRLVASFRAPKDGRFLHGLYSFSENFSGANGDARRECRYGNVWLRTKGGDWLPSRSAKFTHDGHGNRHRLDRRGGVANGRFFLRHGDFATRPMQRGTRFDLPGEPGRPPARLPE
jgi:hypothetical protein